MATDTKTYKVQTIYTAKNDASSALGEIGKAARDSAKATETLTSSLKGLGAIYAGSKIFGEAKRIFVDYNSSIEQHKVVIAGMLSMYTGMSIDKTFARATQSVDRFQEMARKSALTTKQLVDMASQLTRPLIASGLSMSQIERVSFGAANAAKAFGTDTEFAARQIERALTRGVTVKDGFSRAILGQKEVGLTPEKFNALLKSDPNKAIDIYTAGLKSKSIIAMAKKQGEETFDGVKSTLIDNYEILGGKIGKPMFAAITQEIRRWNEWLDKNQAKVSEIGREVATTLVSGFRHLKDVMAWIWDHSGTLIAVAKAYAAIKIGQGILGSGIGMLAGGAGTVSGFAGAATKSVGGFAGVAKNAGAIGSSLGAGYALGTLLNNTYSLSDSFSRAKTVNGEVLDMADQTTAQYAYMIESMKSLQTSTDQAADRLRNLAGAGGGVRSINLAGQADHLTRQAEFIKDLRKQGGLVGKNEPGFAESLIYGGMEKDRKKLEDSKLFDAEDLQRIRENPDKYAKDTAFLGQNDERRRQNAVSAADAAYNVMSDEMRKGREKQDITNALMAKLLEITPHSKTQFDPYMTLTKQQMKEALDELDKSDIKGQKNPMHQTVNITVQQVMAKDPNRWLADMDDLVKRRTTNPTRSRGSWRASP